MSPRQSAETLAKLRCKRHEGANIEEDRHWPYKCSEGYWTVGYGHRCGQDEWPSGVSQLEADWMFDDDWKQAQEQAELIGIEEGVYAKAIGPERVGVLTEMVFQMGPAGVRKFKRMWAALARMDFTRAALEMLDSRWHKQTPKRAETLADVMRSGICRSRDS